MTEEQFKKILKQLEDHEKRIRVLEDKKGEPNLQIAKINNSKKISTLAEVIRGKSFKSGQEKVAVIVGYYEQIVQKDSIKEIDVKDGWKAGKFDGKYSQNFLTRAIKDDLVRNIDSVLDLSQTGERFFANFLKADVGSN